MGLGGGLGRGGDGLPTTPLVGVFPFLRCVEPFSQIPCVALEAESGVWKIAGQEGLYNVCL